jgi:hypothetical protein
MHMMTTNFQIAMQNMRKIMKRPMLKYMYQEAHTSLYGECPTSHLVAIMLLLNLITTHGVNNLFVDELFALLRLDLFPKDNILPKLMYHVKKVTQWLGLSYNSIHACYNGCVLFRGEFGDASTYPKCNKSQYIEGSDQVPSKVL